MLTTIQNLPEGLTGLRASGRVTPQDFSGAVEPLLEVARENSQRMRVLYEFPEDFVDFSPSNEWRDIKLASRYLRVFAGCAIVSKLGWLRDSATLLDLLLSCPARAFDLQDRDAALEWLGRLATGAPACHQLLPDLGVITVDIQRPLRMRELDALTFTADDWIASHGALGGMVIQAREFPGWEHLGNIFKRLHFASRNHLKIRRIALVGDQLPTMFELDISDHFPRAEVKSFPYAEIASATTWAAEHAVELQSGRSAAASQLPLPSRLLALVDQREVE